MIRVDYVPRGIVMMVAATALFTVASAVSKWLVADYPIGEVLFLRSFSSFVTCGAIFLPVHGLKIFATQRPRDHMLRGLSQSISQFALLMAFRLMPIAGAIAISFSAPLFAAVVSIVWLRERAGPVRITALLIGFFGVLIVTEPGASSLTPGALFALTNAVMYGSVTVAVRGMARTELAMTLGDLAAPDAVDPARHATGVRLAHAVAARRGAVLQLRLPQRFRSVVLDQVAAHGARGRGDAVLLSDDGLGAAPWLHRLGRCAVAVAVDRLGNRRDHRAVPVLARDAAASPAGLSTSRDTTPGVPIRPALPLAKPSRSHIAFQIEERAHRDRCRTAESYWGRARDWGLACGSASGWAWGSAGA